MAELIAGLAPLIIRFYENAVVWRRADFESETWAHTWISCWPTAGLWLGLAMRPRMRPKLFELLFPCVCVLSLTREDAAFNPNCSAVGSLALPPLRNDDIRLKVFLRNVK